MQPFGGACVPAQSSRDFIRFPSGFDIHGYAHESGNSLEQDRQLSIRRAELVQSEIVRDGVPHNRLHIFGVGGSSPLVRDKPYDPQNQFVEIGLWQ
jgi:outer membrane protein OmpA-like peptidoglycan-associated protein